MASKSLPLRFSDANVGHVVIFAYIINCNFIEFWILLHKQIMAYLKGKGKALPLQPRRLGLPDLKTISTCNW
jgi:hypothetical protein